MLYQLSYSPKELGYLCSRLKRYTSAVHTEADVYLKRWKVARAERKKQRQPIPVVLVLVLVLLLDRSGNRARSR